MHCMAQHEEGSRVTFPLLIRGEGRLLQVSLSLLA